jgi:hypothetical protein
MSEWNYTKCSTPFATQEEAREFMLQKGYGGHILLRDHGGFTAVCLTYPDGYYPDAIVVESIAEAKQSEKLSPASKTMPLPVVEVQSQECCG